MQLAYLRAVTRWAVLEWVQCATGQLISYLRASNSGADGDRERVQFVIGCVCPPLEVVAGTLVGCTLDEGLWGHPLTSGHPGR